MESLTSNIFLFIGTIIISFFIGTLLRKYLNIRRTKKLISELESYFGQKLPSYKKNRDAGKVNWQRVLKMLKNEPTTQQVANWRQRVKNEMK